MYTTTVIPAMKEQFGFRNVMQVPRVEKVVLNVGYGRHVKDNAFIDRVEQTLTAITGQKPVHNKTQMSISNFKIRKGMNVGVSVTLRGKRMYDFLDKLVSVTLPRVRDFRGLNPKSFDQAGNYSFGFKEQIAFPEITGAGVDNIHGLQVVISTTAHTRDEGFALLSKLGFPFKDK